MNEQVRLNGLLFSQDAGIVGVMSEILKSFAIETRICPDLASALDTVRRCHLDTVIVDWNGIDPTRIVRDTRKSSPNGNSTIVAMVNRDSETHALLVGAHFMIHKPLDPKYAHRCMRAAYGTMLQQRRRSARVSVDIPVLARISGMGAVEACISDLSIGGLALHSQQQLPVDSEVAVLARLPGTDSLIRVTGTIVNAREDRAGIRFSFVPEDDLATLERWLAAELAKLECAEMPQEDASSEGGDNSCSI